MTDKTDIRSAKHYYSWLTGSRSVGPYYHDWHNRQPISWLTQKAEDLSGITADDWHSRQQICQALLPIAGTAGNGSIRIYYSWPTQQAADLSGIATHDRHNRQQIYQTLLLMTDPAGITSQDWNNRQRISQALYPWLAQNLSGSRKKVADISDIATH